MSMGSKLMDIIGDGLSGYETINVDADQFLELLDCYFISKIETDEGITLYALYYRYKY